MDFLYSIIIAFSFFTFIPMPMIEWTDKRMRFVPLVLPLVGLVIGGMLFGLYALLTAIGAGSLLSAVLMTAFLMAITGGVHTDGLMDSADAYFSRRDTERKLEIMKDSRVGAFAVMALIIVVLLKVAFLYEAMESNTDIGGLLIFIPVISRSLQPAMLYFFPFAKEEGLAKMYGADLNKTFGYILLVVFAVICGIVMFISGPAALLVPGVAMLYFCFYYFSVKRNFGGITGDLLGSYLEVAEMLMLGMLLFL